MASYFTLLNLFGEFPLMDNHSVGGRYIGVFTAVVRLVIYIYIYMHLVRSVLVGLTLVCVNTCYFGEFVN